MYEKEAKQQEEKIEKMKAEACDDYGIKKQVNHTKKCKMLCSDLMSLKQKKLVYFFFLPRLLQTKTCQLLKSHYIFIESSYPSKLFNYKETEYELFSTCYQKGHH